jgi:uncharacterized repeat protein (TIGR03803 family)
MGHRPFLLHTAHRLAHAFARNAHRLALILQDFSQPGRYCEGACLYPGSVIQRAPNSKTVRRLIRRSIVTNTRQQRNSKIRLGAASAALTLVVVLMLGLVTTQSAQAQTFTDLYNFTGGADGGYPYATLVRDAAGNLYGTTYIGGSSSYGTVFKVDTSGTETVLYSFTGGADGGYPFAGLVRDTAGNLYGTTYYGGSSNYGTVFKVATSGTETVLHTFAGGTTDGCYPYGGLLRDKAGNLYGTTEVCGASSQGTVFKVATSGTETVLHSFTGGTTDGGNPLYTSLLMDKKGNLYGVTYGGGTSSEGVVYKLSKTGTLTVLHSFSGGTTDGCYPYGTPAMDKKGNLYSTTDSCGSSSVGILWKVSKKGTETVLHNFAGGSTDGAYPIAGVIMDAKGNLYGDTDGGGTSSLGTVYKLSKTGTVTLLHSFAGSDGEIPIGGLIRDSKGTLYGDTVEGGSGSYGTVWQLTK